VQTGRSKVEVLGTSFNIKAYDEEPDVEVVLIEGKLRFMADVEAEDVVLSPGERAVFEKDKGIKVSREPVEKYAAWRFGKLVFDETPMEDVSRDLERWFGVKVILTDSRLSSYRFTTTFENQSLQQVLELLELSSPIKSKYEPATINHANQTGESAKVYFSFETPQNNPMTE
jgi:ferric-dicitrate binding protein FerR (iron transport regulator)